MDAFSTKARLADEVLRKRYLVEAYDSLRSKGGQHYRQGIQPIDFIMSQNLDFLAGNVVKYVTRAGRKEGVPAIDDLRKAQHYLEFMVERLEKDDT